LDRSDPGHAAASGPIPPRRMREPPRPTRARRGASAARDGAAWDHDPRPTRSGPDRGRSSIATEGVYGPRQSQVLGRRSTSRSASMMANADDEALTPWPPVTARRSAQTLPERAELIRASRNSPEHNVVERAARAHHLRCSGRVRLPPIPRVVAARPFKVCGSVGYHAG